MREISGQELDRVYTYLSNNENISIIIGGHTDNFGSAEYNATLSLNRAIEVKNYLIAKGIEPDRIQTKGYGELKPIDNNESSEGRQRNRRIEMEVVPK